MGRKGDQQSSYPPESKLEAIRLHFEEGVSHRSIMGINVVNQLRNRSKNIFIT